MRSTPDELRPILTELKAPADLYVVEGGDHSFKVLKRAGDKRLAVRTEDHPIEYLNFEGNIPKGEYGAGSMIVWARGQWEPEGDPQKGLAKGHLAFTLDGSRLKGRWHLVRMRPRSGEKTEPWLLIKSDDEFGRHTGDLEITDEVTTSQLSGRTNEELAAAGEVRKDHAADRWGNRCRGCERHFELQRLAGRSEGRPLGPVPLLRLRCSLLRRV